MTGCSLRSRSPLQGSAEFAPDFPAPVRFPLLDHKNKGF
jgi:hypothetical protein